MRGTPSTQLTAGSIELSTGVTLKYQEAGSPSGIPVVLLHGISDSMRSFDRVLAHLPDTIHAFALSQRGHGDSSHPEAGYGPADLASDVAAFLDAVALPRAVIVGHSMGSQVAQQVAVTAPARTHGLVLIGAFFVVPGHPVWTELDRAAAELADPVDREFVLEFQKSTLAQRVPDEFLDLVVQESLKLPARVWRAITREFLSARALELGAIRTDTLVFWGDLDAYCSRSEQDALIAGIPQVRLLTYAGAGHALHWEEPARLAADLAAFVQTLH
jgi:non-heme chloroperoxidase